MREAVIVSPARTPLAKAHRGGPMAYADQVGLDQVLADIREFARGDPLFWRPSPLLERLVAQGRNFDSLNHR